MAKNLKSSKIVQYRLLIFMRYLIKIQGIILDLNLYKVLVNFNSSYRYSIYDIIFYECECKLTLFRVVFLIFINTCLPYT